MKRRYVAAAIPLLFIMLSLSGIGGTIQEPDVATHFSFFDWGIVVVLWNGEEKPLHNISIERIEIGGYVFAGAPTVSSVKELEAHQMCYLATPVFGFGQCVVALTLCYEYGGERYTTEMYGSFMVLGGIVLLLNEW